jgi:hypothetical protein
MASHLNKFEFMGELGRGAFGVVYKVFVVVVEGADLRFAINHSSKTQL